MSGSSDFYMEIQTIKVATITSSSILDYLHMLLPVNPKINHKS